MGLRPAHSSSLRDQLAPAREWEEGRGSWENSLELLNVIALPGVSLTASCKVAIPHPPLDYSLPKMAEIIYVLTVCLSHGPQAP